MRFNLTAVCFQAFMAALAFGAVIPPSTSPQIDVRSANTFKNVMYFGDWKVYNAERPVRPSMIQGDQVSHVLYGFGKIAEGGEVSIDLDAALRMKGIHELMDLKIKNRGVKTLFSIGGWTYTHDMHTLQDAVRTPGGRAVVIRSSINIMKNYGFDGLDIDWECPDNDEEAVNFVALLKEMRIALDAYSKKSAGGYHFLMTVASPAGPKSYNIMHLKEMDTFLDAWHLMSYDFAGTWSPSAGHGSNLYASSDPFITPFSADRAVIDYISAGIPAAKIVLGMPLYGHTFANTEGVGLSHANLLLDTPDFRILPKPGAKEHYDAALGATYSYDPASKELITYQGISETHQKVQYIKDKGLGGAMYWQFGGDGDGDRSIVNTVAKDLASLDRSKNLLHYPDSEHAFIRDVQAVQEGLESRESKPKKKSKSKGDKYEIVVASKTMKPEPGAMKQLGQVLGLWW